VTATAGDIIDDDISDSDTGDSWRGDSSRGDADDVGNCWRGGDEHTGLTAACVCSCDDGLSTEACCDCDLSTSCGWYLSTCWGWYDDNGISAGGDALMTCEPLDMFNWLWRTLREFNVPVCGDTPNNIVRELVDLHATSTEQWHCLSANNVGPCSITWKTAGTASSLKLEVLYKNYNHKVKGHCHYIHNIYSLQPKK